MQSVDLRLVMRAKTTECFILTFQTRFSERCRYGNVARWQNVHQVTGIVRICAL